MKVMIWEVVAWRVSNYATVNRFATWDETRQFVCTIDERWGDRLTHVDIRQRADIDLSGNAL
jgi:hypothetical protein